MRPRSGHLAGQQSEVVGTNFEWNYAEEDSLMVSKRKATPKKPLADYKAKLTFWCPESAAIGKEFLIVC